MATCPLRSLSFLALLGSTALRTGWSEVTADRPGFGDSVEVVGQGVTQYEAGFAIDRSRPSGTRAATYSGFQSLVRVGLSNRIELRAASDGYAVQSIQAAGSLSRVAGFSDHVFGTKISVRDEGKFWPAISVLGNVSFPTGINQFTSGGIDPEIRISWARTFLKRIAASGTFDLASPSFSDGRTLSRAFSFSAGHPLLYGLSGFVEVYRIAPVSDSDSAWKSASGVSYAIGNNAQLDISTGITLIGGQSDSFVAWGLVVRSPRLWRASAILGTDKQTKP